jgi:hypothetical protein
MQAHGFPPGWKKPLPERLAKPTYWPAALALGAMLALLGPVTLMAVTIVGVIVCVIAIAGWIGAIVHE